ncbi:MAG: hypothetical protein AAF705_00055 [Bacteroidota bacterium]
MKVLQLLVMAVVLTVISTSCDREGFVSEIDNTPEFEVVEETVSSSNLSIGASSFICDVVTLATTFEDSLGTNVHSYSLSLQATDVSVSGAVFASVWLPAVPETELQETTYSGDMGLAFTISQEGLDAFADWEANGGNPDTVPDLNDYTTMYDGSNLTYTVSNITDATADVVLAGSIEDQDGNTTDISGSFTATLY